MEENPILSAALEDAEGHALAEKILVERVTACVAAGLHSYGKAKCSACGVTPLENESQAIRIQVGLQDYYDSIPAPTYDPFKATKLKLAQLHEETGKPVRHTQRLNGPSSLQVWIDEAQEWRDAHAPSAYSDLFNHEGQLVSASIEFQCVDVSNEFMALMLGYNSAEEMLEENRKRQELWDQIDDSLRRPVDAPPVDVDSVRWAPETHRLIQSNYRELRMLERMLGIEET